MPCRNFLKVQRFYFGLVGFDFLAPRRCWPNPHKALLIMLPAATFLPTMCTYAVQHLQDVDKLTNTLTAMLVSLQGLFKFSMCIYLRRDFSQLGDRLLRLLCSERRQSALHAQIIDKETQRDQSISSLYINFFFFSCTLANLLPLLRMLSGYLRTGHTHWELLFLSAYPWDNHCLRNYLVSYAWNMCASYGIVIASINIDTIFSGFTHNLCALTKIAQYKVMHFKDINDDASSHKLSAILALYQAILDMCGELNACFQPIIFAQFFVASIHLCVLGYQLSATLNQMVAAYYASFVLSMLVQLYIYCFCAVYLTSEVSQFAWAIYDSQWYEVRSRRIVNSLLTSMIRAQRGCRFVGYFFEADMPTFLRIVQAAISYVTLLRSFA